MQPRRNLAGRVAIQDVEILRCSHAVDIQSSRYRLHKIIDASPHQILQYLNSRSRPPRPEPRSSRKTTHASHTIRPHPKKSPTPRQPPTLGSWQIICCNLHAKLTISSHWCSRALNVCRSLSPKPQAPSPTPKEANPKLPMLRNTPLRRIGVASAHMTMKHCNSPRPHSTA